MLFRCYSLIYFLYSVLGANGEIGRTNKFLIDKKIIFTGRVGTLGKIFISYEKVWLTDNTLIINAKKENFYFVYFLLKKAKLENMNVGIKLKKYRFITANKKYTPKI